MDNLTRAEKAIKIAIHEGWREKTHDEIEEALNSDGWCEKYENPQTYAPYHDLDGTVLGHLYSSFNGLMPIFVKINHTIENVDYQIIIGDNLYTTNSKTVVTTIPADNAGSLIDALQDAILFYFENKGE